MPRVYIHFKDQSAQHQDKLHKLWSALSNLMNFVKLDKLFETGWASWTLLSLMKPDKLHKLCEARCNSEWTLGVLALNLIISLRIIIVEPGGPRTVSPVLVFVTFPQSWCFKRKENLWGQILAFCCRSAVRRCLAILRGCFFYLFCRLRAPTRGLATWQASIFGLLKPRFLILVHAVRRSLAILCGCVSFVLFLSFSRSHRRVGHLASLKLSISGLSVSHSRARILYKSAHVSAS